MSRLILFLLPLAFALVTASKIHPDLEATLKEHGSASIIIKFKGGNRPALHLAAGGSRAERLQTLATNLKSLATASQQHAVELVTANSVSFKQFWISNELYVKEATAGLVKELEALPEVEEIRKEGLAIVEPVSVKKLKPAAQRMQEDEAEWNIDIIEAPQAWALPGGNNGTGIVVANLDTGVRGTHEALRGNQRQSYGWYDAVRNAEQPLDEFGVGTHTMGIIAGQGGIGVAPGAEWIACRACEIIGCHDADIRACAQWMLCPTLPDGSREDCIQAPHVILSSFITPSPGDTSFNPVIEAWKAANIIPIFSIGGQSECNSARSPGDQSIVIGVGSTTENDTISERGSKGPGPRNVIKPDIVAPGDRIRSSWADDDNTYALLTGTITGGAHIAGVAALILSDDPSRTYDQVKNIMERTTYKNFPGTGLSCGGISDKVFPNNVYGHGRVNARRAMEDAIGGRMHNN